MIENSKNEKPKKRVHEKVDRIPFTEASLDIIDETIKSVKSKHPGVTINRRDFANWLVQKHFKKLTPAIEKLLIEEFYDDIKHFEKGLLELKRRRKNGEKVSVAEFIKESTPKIKSTPKKKEKTTEKAPKLEQVLPTDSSTKAG